MKTRGFNCFLQSSQLVKGASVRILVTGGAGFIGSHFVRQILDGSLENTSPVDELIVLDSLTYSGGLKNMESFFHDSRFRFVQGDIRDEGIVGRCMVDIDLVFHFAAESHVDNSIGSPKIFIETNVLGTQILLEASRKHNVSKFIHVSTDEVYGSITSGSWTESSPILPNSPYSASKAAADFIVRSYFKTYELPAVITRCSNNYGPNQFPEKVIPRFITNLLTSRPVPIYGNGSNIRDWLHVSDHCRGIWLAALNGTPGEIYNIGGGQELSNLELAKVILNQLGFTDSSIRYVEDRRGHDFRYSLDFGKARVELGYEPLVDFHQGISTTINWYIENRNWWGDLIE
jgi:dTDP-glucose 4,6-dehydratase